MREVGLVICLVIFLAAPYVPTGLLSLLVGSYVGVAALLLATLVAVRADMVLGLGVFLAAGALFLENRKRIVAGEVPLLAPLAASQPAPVAVLDVPAEPVMEGEVHPEPEQAERSEYPFEPEESHTNVFERVDESINEKQPLPTVPANSSAAVATVLERAGVAPI